MKIRQILFVILISLLGNFVAFAQTTAFNFQGRLNDGTSPANGRYDLQFKLFPAITGGSQVASTVDRPNLLLINGVFSTTLDFGASAFTSGDRFVEISVRPNGSPNAHVVLGARQQILTVPYSARAANATQADNATNASSLGGVDASNYARLNFPNTGNLQTSGNVGFGSVAPNTRLTLSGGPQWTASGWTASMNMQNGSAFGWEPNGSGQRFGIGQSNNGLYFFRTYAGFGQTVPPAEIDLQLTDNGHIAQPVGRGGVVKAIVAVTADGTIARCFNGVTGSTLCTGFSVEWATNGQVYFVTFPFQVSNRFWLVNPDSSFRDRADQLTASAGSTTTGGSTNPNVVEVNIRLNGSRSQLPFHLFIF